MIVCLVLVGGLGYYGTKVGNDALETVYNDRLVPVKDLKAISDAYAVNIVDTSHKVRNGNITWDEGLKNVSAAKKIVADSWKAYTGTYLDEKEKALVKDLEPFMKKADDAVTKAEAIIGKRDRQELETFVVKEMYAVIDPSPSGLTNLLNTNRLSARKSMTNPANWQDRHHCIRHCDIWRNWPGPH